MAEKLHDNRKLLSDKSCIESKRNEKLVEKLDETLYFHNSIKLINKHLVFFSWLKEEDKKEVKIDRVKNEEMNMEAFRNEIIDHLVATRLCL